jgi:hypothetical protein
VAFSADLIEVAVRYRMNGKPCQNQCAHAWDGAAVAAATPAQVGEAFWNDVKARLRAIMPAAPGVYYFEEVFVREMGGGETYGAYTIPPGEVNGTRALSDTALVMPNYVAANVKLNVGTSLTRPGSKRAGPLYDVDVIAGNQLSATYLALLEDFAEAWALTHVLGAPVATGVLEPVVASLDTSGAPVEWQPIVGYALKSLVSSQLTRKLT